MSTNVLLTFLSEYYEDNHNINKLLSIVQEGEAKISLRIIDWFVTNFSKKHNVFYNMYKTDTGKLTLVDKGNSFVKQFNTYHSYKSQLKSFSKKRFDPFCRRDRILYKYSADDGIETTVGQLNFFKWAIDNLVIEYIKQNLEIIEADMNTSYQSIKKNKGDSLTRKQRQELSKSASRGLSRNNTSVVISFN